MLYLHNKQYTVIKYSLQVTLYLILEFHHVQVIPRGDTSLCTTL